MLEPFMDYLRKHGIHATFAQLLENKHDCSYGDLETDNYLRYINSKTPSNWRRSAIYSISEGRHWARVYASRYACRVDNLMLVEPTTFDPQLMGQCEKSRGNCSIDDFYRTDEPFTGIGSTMKSLDVLVDKKEYIPKVHTTIVYTSRNNEGNTYPFEVIRMKNDFARYLRRKGVDVKVVNINSHRCADLYPRNFSLLMRLMRR